VILITSLLQHTGLAKTMQITHTAIAKPLFTLHFDTFWDVPIGLIEAFFS
jgi:hypothetical protein